MYKLNPLPLKVKINRSITLKWYHKMQIVIIAGQILSYLLEVNHKNKLLWKVITSVIKVYSIKLRNNNIL